MARMLLDTMWDRAVSVVDQCRIRGKAELDEKTRTICTYIVRDALLKTVAEARKKNRKARRK